MWQTDELRQVRPTPVDEARNAIYYLTGILTDAMPEMLSDLSELLAEHGVTLPAAEGPDPVRLLDRRRPGRQPERHRRPSPSEILQLQNQHAVRISIGLIDELISILSNSTALAGGGPGAAGLDRRRPGEPARPGPPGPGAERAGALPAQAHLHQGQAASTPAGAWRPDPRTSPAATTPPPRSSSPSSACWNGRCGTTTRRWPPTAPWPGSAAPSPPSACTWPPWTSANTPTTTMTPSAS